MKQEMGWTAAIAVAVATTIGVSSHFSARPSVDGASAVKAPGQFSTKSKATTDQFEQGPCVDIEEHLQAFLVNGKEDSIAAPASCFDETELTEEQRVQGDALRAKAKSLRFVIATLPDPLHTHFPLSFDRLIEAIQQGATDEGYTYDSSWLPWETKEDQFALIDDQDKEDRRKEAREKQPGVVLFRRTPSTGDANASQPYADGLVVFIVGEEPTQGIHRSQFMNAAAWMAALGPLESQDHQEYRFPERILGPSFSGSLPSLASALIDLKQRSKIQYEPDLSIYSGSVTSKTLVQWFVDATKTSITPHLLSFQTSDDDALGLYCRYLHGSGLNLSNLAIVSEDETAYGADLKTDDKAGSICKWPDQWPVKLFYPRDLSALRTAYQKQSIFNQPADESAQDGTRRTLNSDIADPEGRQHDTIRNYSGDQTAMSQEAVLQQIVSQLRVHESEYIVLRSSSPLDQLFLSHYLRLAYPQGRIVILGADLLLRRESGAARLSGVMTLSTYPLLPWEPHWTRAKEDPNPHTHRVFPQDGAEGTYLAARYLLHAPSPFLNSTFWYSMDVEVTGEPEGRFLSITTDPLFRNPDYGTPFWDRRYATEPPQVWLSVLGRNDFWPIAALNQDSLHKNPVGVEQWIRKHSNSRFSNIYASIASLGRILTLVWAKTADYGNTGPHWHPWPPVPTSMRIALVMIFTWAAFHFFCCSFPSIMAKPSHRAYFVRFEDERRTHLTLLTLGCLAVSWTATVLGWGFGAMSPDGAPLAHAWAWLSLLPLLWTIVGVSLGANICRQYQAMPLQMKTKDARNKKEEPIKKDGLMSAFRGASRTTAQWLMTTFRKAARATAQWLNDTDQEKEPTKKKRLINAFRKAARTMAQWLKDVANSIKLNRHLLWRPLLAYAGGVIGFYFLLYFCTENELGPANRIPTYWRNMNLTSGVSPLIPLLAPGVGLYMWFWYSLQGLSYFGPDHPQLPPESSLEIKVEDEKKKWLRMFSQKFAADPVETQCKPFAGEALRVGIPLLLILIPFAFFIADGLPIRSLGASSYSILICVLMDICVSAMLADAWRLLRSWMKLCELLTFLYRLRLRRSMAAFPGVSWGSVWKISGNVLEMRYKLLTRQVECATHLQNALKADRMKPIVEGNERVTLKDADLSLDSLQAARKDFAEWYSENWDNPTAHDLEKLEKFQNSLAECAGKLVTKVLLPAWGKEAGPSLDGESPECEKGNHEKEGTCLIPVAELEPHIRFAEQLVCYVYLGFIQNILGRMRSIVMSILWLFIAGTVAMASYPFDPRPALSGAMALLFAVLGAVIVFVYAQMHRDPILSLVTNTTPGELGGEFWLKLAGFGAGPVLGLLATIFPELTDILFTWIQPSISSVR